MIRVALTDAAYDAIASTLPKGAARWPMQRDRGQSFIQVEAAVVDRMRAMRRPGESYSQVILRLVELETGPPRPRTPIAATGNVSKGRKVRLQGSPREGPECAKAVIPLRARSTLHRPFATSRLGYELLDFFTVPEMRGRETLPADNLSWRVTVMMFSRT
jgi:hypothetical protein